MFALLVSVTLAAPVIPEAGEMHRDSTRLQGKWRLVSCRFMGGELVDGGKLEGKIVSIQIDGTTVMWADGKRTSTEAIKIDPAKRPRAIDFGEAKQVNRAIYRVEGDRLRLCFYQVLGDRRMIADTPRPRRFDDEYRVLMIFEREGSR
jgi:uncharacterized protein (TIGR03067 family)